MGIIASLHFGLWYYLGIEGTCQAAEEVRSPARSLPYGTMAGIMTLLIAATHDLVCLLGPDPVGVSRPGRHAAVRRRARHRQHAA